MLTDQNRILPSRLITRHCINAQCDIQPAVGSLQLRKEKYFQRIRLMGEPGTVCEQGQLASGRSLGIGCRGQAGRVWGLESWAEALWLVGSLC